VATVQQVKHRMTYAANWLINNFMEMTNTTYCFIIWEQLCYT